MHTQTTVHSDSRWISYSTAAKDISPPLSSRRSGGGRKHGLCLAQLRILFQLRVPLGRFLITSRQWSMGGNRADRKRKAWGHAPGGRRVLPQLSPAESRCRRPFFRSRVLDSPAGKDMDGLSESTSAEGVERAEGMVVVHDHVARTIFLASHDSAPSSLALMDSSFASFCTTSAR